MNLFILLYIYNFFYSVHFADAVFWVYKFLYDAFSSRITGSKFLFYLMPESSVFYFFWVFFSSILDSALSLIDRLLKRKVKRDMTSLLNTSACIPGSMSNLLYTLFSCVKSSKMKELFEEVISSKYGKK